MRIKGRVRTKLSSPCLGHHPSGVSIRHTLGITHCLGAMLPITTPAAGCHPATSLLIPSLQRLTHILTRARTHAHTHPNTSCSLVLSSTLVSLPQTGHYPTLLSLLQCPGGNARGEVLGVTSLEPPSEVPGAQDKVNLTSEWINVNGLMGTWTCSHTCW